MARKNAIENGVDFVVVGWVGKWPSWNDFGPGRKDSRRNHQKWVF